MKPRELENETGHERSSRRSHRVSCNWITITEAPPRFTEECEAQPTLTAENARRSSCSRPREVFKAPGIEQFRAWTVFVRAQTGKLQCVRRA